MEEYPSVEEVLDALATIIYESDGGWYNSYIESCDLTSFLGPKVVTALYDRQNK